MAERPVWKGQLRLSLVSIPVQMYSATRPGARISFRQIHEPSGKPVRYQKTVSGIGPIDADEIVKGLEVSKGRYVLIDPAEIDRIRLETRKTLELVQFVDACEIPPIYYDKPYYLVPEDELAGEAYRVVRDALRETRMAGLGQVTMRGREYLAAVRPCGDGLLLETLHYADEIHRAELLFTRIEDDRSDPQLLEVATELIRRKTGRFDAKAFTDHYTSALRELVDRHAAGARPKQIETDDAADRRGDNVVDLMAALRKSLDGEDDSRGRKRAAGTKTAKRKPAGRAPARPRKSA